MAGSAVSKNYRGTGSFHLVATRAAGDRGLQSVANSASGLDCGLASKVVPKIMITILELLLTYLIGGASAEEPNAARVMERLSLRL